MKIKDLDLNLLKVFTTLIRKHSVTLAAHELSMTQSAISNALRRLRRHFDDELFVKTNQGMMPTLLAEKLAPPIVAAFHQIQVAIDSVELFDPSTSTRSFCLYTSDVGQLILAPRLLKAIERDSHQIAVSLVHVSPARAKEMMMDGSIDIAIGTFDDFQVGFHSQRLFTKSYVVIARQGHAIFFGQLTLDDFLRARFATYHPPAESHDDFEKVLESLYKSKKAKRNVSIELAHGLGIGELIASSDLLCCIPRRLAENLAKHAAIEICELPFTSPTIDVSQYWHDKVHSDLGHQWFRTLVYKSYSAY